jgi:predicted GNAT family acetyltransferase
MEAQVHETSEAFRAAADELLSADPIRNTVVLTAVARNHENALLVTLHDQGTVVGAVIRVPPYPVNVSAMPIEAAELVAKTVLAADPTVDAASGPLARVDAFKDAWTGLTNTTAKKLFGLRLFKLGHLETPAIAGRARPATEDDVPLLSEWTDLFMDETLRGVTGRESGEEQARRSLTPGNISMIWEVDGKPVAFAGARGPFSGMVRVAPVYTPPELRGHGYASAATAAVSQWALDQEAEHILLYTDLANEVTNRIYPRLGYQAVEDFMEYTFS